MFSPRRRLWVLLWLTLEPNTYRARIYDSNKGNLGPDAKIAYDSVVDAVLAELVEAYPFLGPHQQNPTALEYPDCPQLNGADCSGLAAITTGLRLMQAAPGSDVQLLEIGGEEERSERLRLARLVVDWAMTLPQEFWV